MKRFNYYWNNAKKAVEKITILTGVLVLLVAGGSCQRSSDKDCNGCTPPATVLAWNEIATQAFLHFPEQPAPPPMIESRIYAMVNIAMHDALNNIKKKYKTYALESPDKAANPDAAVAQAAYDVLVAEAPWYKSKYDSLLDLSLSPVADAEKAKGIALGHAAATAIKNKRINDGSATAQFQYVPGNSPGQYQFTAPFDGPPFNGLYAIPGWGKVKPFALTASAQFRPGLPLALNSSEYTADFDEIKKLGSVNSTSRTADQTHSALFWTESSPIGWNRIARILIANQNGNGI